MLGGHRVWEQGAWLAGALSVLHGVFRGWQVESATTTTAHMADDGTLFITWMDRNGTEHTAPYDAQMHGNAVLSETVRGGYIRHVLHRADRVGMVQSPLSVHSGVLWQSLAGACNRLHPACLVTSRVAGAYLGCVQEVTLFFFAAMGSCLSRLLCGWFVPAPPRHPLTRLERCLYVHPNTQFGTMVATCEAKVLPMDTDTQWCRSEGTRPHRTSASDASQTDQ